MRHISTKAHRKGRSQRKQLCTRQMLGAEPASSPWVFSCAKSWIRAFVRVCHIKSSENFQKCSVFCYRWCSTIVCKGRPDGAPGTHRPDPQTCAPNAPRHNNLYFCKLNFSKLNSTLKDSGPQTFTTIRPWVLGSSEGKRGKLLSQNHESVTPGHPENYRTLAESVQPSQYARGLQKDE